jgi:HTH-type transcriptional regulator / antitoxin HigA
MNIRPIRSRRDHAKALDEIERLMGSRKGSPAAKRLEVLVALVAAWEERLDPIDAPDPIEAIRAHMTDNGLGQADFARLLGTRSLASDILNRRRSLSLGAIRKISAAWNIPADVLIRPYKLTRPGAAA